MPTTVWDEIDVGLSLKTAREQRNVSLSALATQTGISERCLRALECDDIESCGGITYARIFTKSVSQALRIDPTILLDALQLPQYARKHPRRAVSLFSAHRWVKFAGIAIVILLVAGALGWEILRVTAPPTLIVQTPTDNLLTKDHTVELAGKAAPESKVSINNSPIGVGRDGSFRETLDLRTGLNIITITATKKYAKPNVVYRRVVVSNE